MIRNCIFRNHTHIFRFMIFKKSKLMVCAFPFFVVVFYEWQSKRAAVAAAFRKRSFVAILWHFYRTHHIDEILIACTSDFHCSNEGGGWWCQTKCNISPQSWFVGKERSSEEYTKCHYKFVTFIFHTQSQSVPPKNDKWCVRFFLVSLDATVLLC